MKRWLVTVLLLLPRLAPADALSAVGLAEAFEVFGLLSLGFVFFLVVLVVVSWRRPHAPGLLRWHGALLAALVGACAIAALLHFFLKPLLALLAVAGLLFVVALAGRARPRK